MVLLKPERDLTESKIELEQNDNTCLGTVKAGWIDMKHVLEHEERRREYLY